MADDMPWPDTTARVFLHHDGVCCASHDDPKVSDSMEPVVWQGGGPRAHVSIYKYVMKSYDLAAVIGSIKSLCFLSLDINVSSMVNSHRRPRNLHAVVAADQEQSSSSVITCCREA
jgi:hypothetical protein